MTQYTTWSASRVLYNHHYIGLRIQNRDNVLERALGCPRRLTEKQRKPIGLKQERVSSSPRCPPVRKKQNANPRNQKVHKCVPGNPRDSFPPRRPASVSACREISACSSNALAFLWCLSPWIQFLSGTVCSLLFLAFSTDRNHLVYNPWRLEAVQLAAAARGA